MPMIYLKYLDKAGPVLDTQIEEEKLDRAMSKKITVSVHLKISWHILVRLATGVSNVRKALLERKNVKNWAMLTMNIFTKVIHSL